MNVGEMEELQLGVTRSSQPALQKQWDPCDQLLQWVRAEVNTLNSNYVDIQK